MKVSVIGYPALWRRQAWMLQELAKQVDLRVEVPTQWKNKTPEDHLSDLAYNAHHTFFSGKIRFHLQPRIARSINNWNPDVVVSWVEPHHLNSLLINRVHAPLIYFTWETLPSVPHNPLLQYADRKAYARTDGLICGSAKAAHRARTKGFEGSVELLPQTGVNTEFFRPMTVDRTAYGLDDDKVVLFVGRLASEKGLEYLIKAMDGIEATLLIAGDGPDRTRLEHLAQQTAPENIRFLGWQPYNVLPELYNLADVFVFPSITTETWEEQFGYAMFEALACETPVIATDTGAIPEVTPDSVTLLPERDVGALQEALRTSYQPDSSGRDWIRKQLENSVVAKKYADIAEAVA